VHGMRLSRNEMSEHSDGSGAPTPNYSSASYAVGVTLPFPGGLLSEFGDCFCSGPLTARIAPSSATISGLSYLIVLTSFLYGICFRNASAAKDPCNGAYFSSGISLLAAMQVSISIARLLRRDRERQLPSL